MAIDGTLNGSLVEFTELHMDDKLKQLVADGSAYSSTTVFRIS
jgi:hypothetical protein